jgi:hypothetical protein
MATLLLFREFDVARGVHAGAEERPLRPEANARCGLPPLLLWLTCLAPSVDVLRRQLVSAAVVTQLVTHRLKGPFGQQCWQRCSVASCPLPLGGSTAVLESLRLSPYGVPYIINIGSFLGGRGGRSHDRAKPTR